MFLIGIGWEYTGGYCHDGGGGESCEGNSGGLCSSLSKLNVRWLIIVVVGWMDCPSLIALYYNLPSAGH